jgi:hypothetical protein
VAGLIAFDALLATAGVIGAAVFMDAVEAVGESAIAVFRRAIDTTKPNREIFFMYLLHERNSAKLRRSNNPPSRRLKGLMRA